MSPDGEMNLDAFVARDETGMPTVAFALVCTLYLRRAVEAEHRGPIRELINRYVDLTKDELRWLMPTKTGARALHVSSVVEELDAKLASLENDDAWEIHLHGGSAPGAASSIGLEISLRQRWEAEAPHNHLSFVSFRFPMGWFDALRPGFVSFVASVCEMLQPVHGCAGIGVVAAADRAVAARYEEPIATLAERFAGLEIDYPAKHLIWVRAGIKGVNWLTILGDELLERAGGRGIFPSTATLHDYRGGVIVQASPAPIVGVQGSDLDPYRAVAKVLARVRIAIHSGVHGPRGLDRARFEHWLARFD